MMNTQRWLLLCWKSCNRICLLIKPQLIIVLIIFIPGGFSLCKLYELTCLLKVAITIASITFKLILRECHPLLICLWVLFDSHLWSMRVKLWLLSWRSGLGNRSLHLISLWRSFLSFGRLLGDELFFTLRWSQALDLVKNVLKDQLFLRLLTVVSSSKWTCFMLLALILIYHDPLFVI